MHVMKTIYLFLILAGLCVTGCKEVTVGYLKADYAKYSIDTLYIGEGRIQDQIEVKMCIRDSFGYFHLSREVVGVHD